MNSPIKNTTNDRTPYTYLIGWSKTNKYYYGRRTAKNCHPSDLFVKYYTSSTYVRQYIEMHGIPDIIQVRKTFSTIDECIKWEIKVLKRLNAKNNKNFLNESNSGNDFDSTGKVAVKDKHSNTFLVEITDPKFVSGEYTALSKGRKYTKEVNEKKANAHGKVAVKDKNGNNFLVLKSDDRYISGELIPVAKGTKTPNKKKGEHMKGHVIAVDQHGNKLRLPKNDPLLKSGVYVPIGTGMPMAKDKSGKIFRTTKDDPRWITGEIVSPALGRSYNAGIPKQKLMCPHCNRDIAINLFNRYHNDNCSLNKERADVS